MTTYTFVVPATLVLSLEADTAASALRDAQAIIDRAQPAEDLYLSGPCHHDVKLWPRPERLTPDHILATIRRGNPADKEDT